MAKINSINNATASLTSDTSLTATNGAITATSGNVVISNGNLTLPFGTSSVGQITMNGVPYLHGSGNTTQSSNLFLGYKSGNASVTGTENTGIGGLEDDSRPGVLGSLSSGSRNTVVGDGAMNELSTGSGNSAFGMWAGYQCLGSNNVLFGYQCGLNGCGDQNTLIGGSYTTPYWQGAGGAYSGTENNNVLIQSPGVNAESNVLRIGQATGTGNAELNSAYICGIYGITVTGTPVLISATDQLGIAVSSAKYKKDITDMPDMSQVIDKLRPVTFHYKDEKQSAQLNYGLIAEEVEQVWPEMVAYDKDGNISTLYYQFLAPILLKEIQALRKEIEELKRRN
jgi:hypothetical protein